MNDLTRQPDNISTIVTAVAGVIVGVAVGLALPLAFKPTHTKSFFEAFNLVGWWINRPVVLLAFAIALARVATRNRERKFNFFKAMFATAGLITMALRQLAHR